ncbi:conserved Plasmodium protein, unknown function [Plasmodium gallinaceum]|uniref:Uncharacterized protein n=1 Tax=Plasmodium gallinaceum TaxID=5849 RepID=A0A1J1GSX8_PLAGA|nr:conserved Plasmodium protein, unknown function [Plasmodium gallinaceum]CRG95550.1 conserved Plasmodium protein, unknown function [Plasmodium gallinaceum]
MEHNFQIKPIQLKFNKPQENNSNKYINSKKPLKAIKNNEKINDKKENVSSIKVENKKKEYNLFKNVKDIKTNTNDQKVKYNIKNKTNSKHNEFIDLKEEKNKLNYINKYCKNSEKKNEVNKENKKLGKSGIISSIKINNENEKCNDIKNSCKNNIQNTQNSKIYTKVIKYEDNYLNDLLKKENVCIQSVKCDEHNEENEEIMLSNNSTLEESSQEDIYSLDLIEQYKLKKKKELETKRKKIILYKKSKLIKKATFRNAETQVILDDFSKYYEKVKPKIEKIVEDILNKALKELYEEQELKKIKSEIDYYENIRKEKLLSLKKFEKTSEDFYEETQEKIKNRIKLKNKVEMIMKKKIANNKAQKNIHYIFQKNLDLYSLMDLLPNNFEKFINLIIIPWISEFIYYIVNVNKEIVHHIMTDMIEQSIISSSEIYEKFKRLTYIKNKKIK